MSDTPIYMTYDVDCRTEVEISDKDIALCRNERELENMIYGRAKDDARECLVIRIDREAKDEVLQRWKQLKGQKP